MESDPRMEKMLERARKMKEREQRRLAKMTATSTALKGRFKATMNGHRSLVSVHVDPDLLTLENRAQLERTAVQVINRAASKIDEKLGSKFGSLDSLPSLFSDFFDPDR